MVNLTATQIQNITTEYPVVGYQVCYSLGGVEITRPVLKTLADAVPDVVGKIKPEIPNVTDKEALRRAVESWRDGRIGRGSEGTNERSLIRTINSASTEYVTFALVSEHADFAALGLSHGTTLRFLLHKKSGELLVRTDSSGMDSEQTYEATCEAQGVKDEVMPLWQESKQTLLTGDISRYIVSLIQYLDGVRLLPNGYVYYVPAESLNGLDAVAELIHNLSPDCYCIRTGVPTLSSYDMTMAIVTGIKLDIENDMAELGKAIDRQRTGTEIREKTMGDFLESIQAAELRITAWQSVLESGTGTLTQLLDVYKAMSFELVTGGS